MINDLRYADKDNGNANSKSNELAFLKIRYKLPGEDTSELLEFPIIAGSEQSDAIKREANFAAAVAGFAQLLKDGKYLQDWNYDDAIELAQGNKGEDEYGYRTEFVQLIRKAGVAKEMEQ